MMFRNIRKYKQTLIFKDQEIKKTVDNALTESLILHIRILTGIILSYYKYPDDITLKNILPGFNSNYIEDLRISYGTNKDINSPCWQFNKLLAHASTERSDAHNYSEAVELLTPIIEKILNNITKF